MRIDKFEIMFYFKIRLHKLTIINESVQVTKIINRSFSIYIRILFLKDDIGENEINL